MDPGTILAVVDLSAKLLSLISKYYSDVRDAKDDITRLMTEIRSFQTILLDVEKLAEASKPQSLPVVAIKESLSDIHDLINELGPSSGRKVMKRVGLRALKWPFSSGQVTKCIERLERHKTAISLGLNVEQTGLTRNINSKVNQIRQNQDLASQDQQLAKLPFADGATFNSHYRQHEPRCTQNTRVDLLRQLQEWKINHEKKVFWLKGMAGTGKSTIARTIASIFFDQNCLGASFFFSRGAGDLGHAAKFVSTIARQVADLSPLIRHNICEALAQNDKITQQGLQDQWDKLIFQPLQGFTGQFLSIIVVVDALDECEHKEDIRLILELFIVAKVLPNINFKILVTSRPETPIRIGFGNMDEIIYHSLALHNIPRETVEHDLFVYLKHELNIIKRARNISSNWPAERDIELLVQRSDCLFIYAATACRFIEDEHWLPEERLSMILQGDIAGNSPTAKLDSMYIQILNHSIFKDRDEEEKVKLSKRFKQIIGSIVILFDILPVFSLVELLSISIQQMDVTLSPLHSVLNIPSNQDFPIRLLHPSFRDFLLDEKRCQEPQIRIEEETAHANLVTHCIELMFRTLKRNICNLKDPCIHVRDIPSDQIKFHLPKHLQYACVYWVDHLARIGHDRRIKLGLCVNGRIHEFLKEHLLHWLEVLCLLGNVFSGGKILEQLASILQFDTLFALYNLAKDAQKFWAEFIYKLPRTPLQLYHFSFLFMPLDSVLTNDCSNQLPPRIRRLPVSEIDLNFLVNMEGEVALSPNHKQLASTSDRGETILFWEVKSEVPSQELRGHSDVVRCVAFSPNGEQLASASDDKTIRLWDAKTGAALRTLHGHSDRVLRVTFSPNSEQLASASDDKTIRLWDAKTGAALRTLHGHSDRVLRVTFSPNSEQLASASDDKTIRLWDAKTGAALRELHGHSDRVLRFTFSPKREKLASASDDKTIRLWDAKTAAALRTLHGHSDRVLRVTFSPNGEQLASASWDETTRLWDSKSGAALDVPNLDDMIVNDLKISPDSQCLAIASETAVSVYDFRKRRVCEEIHVTDVPRQLQFSADGSHIYTNFGQISCPHISGQAQHEYQSLLSTPWSVSRRGLMWDSLELIRLPIASPFLCSPKQNQLLIVDITSEQLILLEIQPECNPFDWWNGSKV